jgi:hypothetical protein
MIDAIYAFLIENATALFTIGLTMAILVAMFLEETYCGENEDDEDEHSTDL